MQTPYTTNIIHSLHWPITLMLTTPVVALLSPIIPPAQPTTPVSSSDVSKSCAPSFSYTSHDDDNPFTSDPMLMESPYIESRRLGEAELPAAVEIDKDKGMEGVGGKEMELKVNENVLKRMSFTGKGLMLARQRTSFNSIMGNREEKVILKGISLYFNPGEMIGIMGPSGED